MYRYIQHLAIGSILIVLISGCSSSPRYGSEIKTSRVGLSASKKTASKTNRKRTVNHRKIIKGVSSYYAEDFHGKLTANGEVYDMYGLTAAHKTIKIQNIEFP